MLFIPLRPVRRAIAREYSTKNAAKRGAGTKQKSLVGAIGPEPTTPHPIKVVL
jgi:hypothetical protein